MRRFLSANKPPLAPRRGRKRLHRSTSESATLGTWAALYARLGTSSSRFNQARPSLRVGSFRCGDTRQIGLRSLVGTAGQVYCGDAAQRLSSFAHDRRKVHGPLIRLMRARFPQVPLSRPTAPSASAAASTILRWEHRAFRQAGKSGTLAPNRSPPHSTTRALADRERQKSSALAKMSPIPSRPDG
jgi:hypothetical protein